ncbi:MAG: M23 family metallopeptidase [Burkholderiales bacterium]|nr:M23 family metallopeptidase [Burkholderiales bacterium]
MLAIVASALGAAGWFVGPRLESVAPQVAITPEGEAAGQTPLQVQVSDGGTGLRSVTVTLSQGGTEHKIAADELVQPMHEKTYTVALAKVPGIKEGPAVLKVAARDAALWRGNQTVVERRLTLDLTPPTLQLVADDRYVNFGGVGVLVYKTSADTVRTGVQFGTRFFPGFAGQVRGHPDHWLVLFAHAYDVPTDARPKLVAADAAGNSRELAVRYELKNVKYRKSTLPLSERFVRDKVAPLLADATLRQGAPRDVFVAVNQGLRKDNEEKIAALTRQAAPPMLWRGAFVQLSNSKVEANFADERTYTWNGEPIDTAYHLGYDLSVTKAYPVEAANAGTVVFAGDLGIYGGTVIIDHGLGLFTLYSHLSAIEVQVGATLAKKQILGKTGQTGLAAGDHLHYGVYLSGVAVLPVEWWDAQWLEDNLAPKLEGRAGEEVGAAPAKSKAQRKAGGKKRR